MAKGKALYAILGVARSARPDGLAPAEVEVALVARTLVRELALNGPAVEVIRMRQERSQVAELPGPLGRSEQPREK